MRNVGLGPLTCVTGLNWAPPSRAFCDSVILAGIPSPPPPFANVNKRKSQFPRRGKGGFCISGCQTIGICRERVKCGHPGSLPDSGRAWLGLSASTFTGSLRFRRTVLRPVYALPLSAVRLRIQTSRQTPEVDTVLSCWLRLMKTGKEAPLGLSGQTWAVTSQNGWTVEAGQRQGQGQSELCSQRFGCLRGLGYCPAQRLPGVCAPGPSLGPGRE